MTYWDDVTRHTDTTDIWMGHPAVRAAINRRVSGNPDEWPIAALAKVLADRLPLESALSIGCGTGGLERSLAETGIARKITGIDMSEPALNEARRLGPGIEYHAADARSFLRGKSFDAIFFHQSLHHFDDLDDLMSRVAESLRPNGILYIDEYVGPSRDEWPWWRLALPNLAYRRLPGGTRRAKIVRAPINHEDPTEAIRSSQIVDAVRRRFDVVHRRDYGGNLLALLYPNMNRTSKRFNEAVEQLIEAEDRMLARGAKSFYTVIVAVKGAR
jgi:SAM-dependent methyltransferase